LASPRNIVQRSIQSGLKAIAITDHNSIRGSIEEKSLLRSKKLLVIIGTEIKTNKGDIIGLFL
jgi:predicted metal-dependent phosphoesterase TrpH